METLTSADQMLLCRFLWQFQHASELLALAPVLLLCLLPSQISSCRLSTFIRPLGKIKDKTS